MTITWSELNESEKTALKRLNRGPYPALEPSLAERLIALGLVEQRPSGIGINRAGRELVIGVLLNPRED
ncbi:hypothetical protein IMCC20628_00076 [Hoeflea sp. IMCC20628]|uniref:hypothetical protein n=1 Tax=Hoeflea sp. IMCC20628 TaxID=1620421 RepID=UPI00063ADB9F|nr:hypothetical protein [Hoeflea sp. IMCC20628]AKH98812.1 hypothetical protein IMCC20628_00076 [Hoeflea sp. IMCC20628]